MSEAPQVQTFLERRSYRRRRLIDCICLLPIVGLWLWLMPVLWKTDLSSPVKLSDALIYVFVVWIALVALGAVLVGALRVLGTRDDTSQDQEAENGDA